MHLIIFNLIKSFIPIIPKLNTTRYGTYSYGKIIASAVCNKPYTNGNGSNPKLIANSKTGTVIIAHIANGVSRKFKINTIRNNTKKIVNTLVLPPNRDCIISAIAVEKFREVATVPILMHATTKNIIEKFTFLKHDSLALFKNGVKARYGRIINA